MHWDLDERKKKYLIWAFAVLFVMFGIYMYTHRRSGPANVAPADPVVATEKLALRDMMKRVVLSGETVPKTSVDISPKYAGRIAEVSVDLGDVVQKGDVLLVQDLRDVQISILENSAGSRQASAEAIVSRASYGAESLKAETDYENALAKYERYQWLYEEGAVSLQDRDDMYRQMIEKKAAFQSIKEQELGAVSATVAAKEAAAAKAEYVVEGLRVKEEDLTIKAPVSGVIGYRNAEAGEWATAGQKLLTVVDNSKMYLDCLIAEQDIGTIRTGETLPVSLDAVGETVDGKIIFISPSVEDASRVYRVRLLLETKDAHLRGGLFGRAIWEGVQRKQTLFVPKEAIADENGRKYVYVVSADLTVKKRAVTLGLSNDDCIEILSGVVPGETVAVTNIARLRDGVKVKVDEAAHG